MKTRVVFEEWRNTTERYVAEVWHEPNGMSGVWIEIDRYGNDTEAKRCAELYARGPLVIVEYE